MTARRRLSGLLCVGVLTLLFGVASARADLVAYYPFDDGSGSATATDVVGGFNGTLTDMDPGSDWVTGAPDGFSPGGALDFDGDNDAVLTGTLPHQFGNGLEGNKPKTISAWVYTRAFNQGGIFDMGESGSGKDFALRTMLNNDNTWRVQFWGLPDYDFNADTKDKWAHFAVTHDGAISRTYVNGQLVASKGSNLNTASSVPGNQLGIGLWRVWEQDPGGFDPDNFNGIIDEVAVFDEALLPNQAAYLAGGGDPAGLPAGTLPAELARTLYVQQADNGKWNRVEYYNQSFPLTYGEATTVANDLGGHLATIRDARENARLVQMETELGLPGAWIGLSDQDVEGDWRLVPDSTDPAGTLIWQGVADGAAVGGAYTNWNAIEPNNAGATGEHFGELPPSGLWNDLSAGSARGFFVEYDEQLNAKPTTMLDEGPDGDWGTFGVRMVKMPNITNGLLDVESRLNQGEGTVLSDTQEPTIHFEDPNGRGGGQLVPNPRPFPAYPTDNGVDEDFYVLKAKGTIRITAEQAGPITFAFRGDDGAQLTIKGAAFTDLNNAGGDARATITGDAANPADTLRLHPHGGNLLATAVADLEAGEYEIEYTYFEGNGGSDTELLAAVGAQTGIDTSPQGPFRLIGHQAAPDRYGPIVLGLWNVDVIRDGTANSLTAAIAQMEGYWDGSYTPARIDSDAMSTINLVDPEGGGGGHGALQTPFPGDDAAADDKFSVGAKAQIFIPPVFEDGEVGPGDYTFLVLGDDGARFRIEGTSGWTAAGIASVDPGELDVPAPSDGFVINSCCSDGFGTVNLGSGLYDVELIWDEIGGGAYVGVWVAKGVYTSWDPFAFQLLGEFGNGVGPTLDFDGLQLVPEPSSIALALLGLIGMAFTVRRRRSA